jgi:hypothetical protein
MNLKFKTWHSFHSVTRQFPLLDFSDLENVLAAIYIHPGCKVVALSKRVVLLSYDRKIVARDTISSEKLGADHEV